MESSSIKVSSRYQISLPSTARRELNIEAGDRLLVDVQDGILILVPEPADYVEKLAGLHKEVWAGINTDDYLNGERDEWPAREVDEPTR